MLEFAAGSIPNSLDSVITGKILPKTIGVFILPECEQLLQLLGLCCLKYSQIVGGVSQVSSFD